MMDEGEATDTGVKTGAVMKRHRRALVVLAGLRIGQLVHDPYCADGGSSRVNTSSRAVDSALLNR